MYILGIDYGDKRVGLALAHDIAKLPQPLKTVQNDDSLMETIRSVVDKEDVGRLVVGLPRNMDGSLGAQAEACELFAKELEDALRLPVDMAEEMLSSVEAERSKQVEAFGVDAVAAATILERFLEERGYQQ